MNDKVVGGQERRQRYEVAWERFLLAEQRALVDRAEGILARALVEELPGESREELDRWAEEDRRLAREWLVELMDEEGNTYHRHIDELEPWDVADRLRAETARSDWLAMRTSERLGRREARRVSGHDRTQRGGLPLSRRELEILKYVARGLSNRLIAEEVHLAEATVKRHLAVIYPKIRVNSRSEAVARGVAEGWLALEDIAFETTAPENGASDGARSTAGGRYRCAVDGCAREVVEVAASREEGYLAPPRCHGRAMRPVGTIT
jgi:ATP/maltotriose-dependent transcriptional regulator MalT